ncbi:GyrI-like domain-containing protein [Flavobacterium sp.]|jgi:hypothetical protein|uniref:GyrI-like domain-containing protein n=1 Tax=Flavobacterium sp. TaxID=239 RepID=UPI0037C13D4D
MKILKYLSLLFLLFLLAFVVFVATQPATYEITKQKEINSPSNSVFEYVNDFSNWNDWQQFNTEENFNFTISQNTIGKKSYVKWDYENAIITTFAEKDSISQLFIQDDNKQTLHWKFKKSGNNTLASVTIKGDLSFTEKIYSVLNGGITGYVGPQIQESLNKINNYFVSELGEYDIKVDGLVNRPSINYLEQKDSCLVKDFPKKSKALLKTMKNFIKSNDIETLEVPFVMFQNNENENKIVYAMCVPVKEKVFTTPDSQIQGKNYSSFLAIKTTLKGDYSHMKKAWAKTRNYIVTKKFNEDKKGFYIGIYKKSIPEVNEPSKWVTEIYIPIIKKEAAPEKVIVKDSTVISTTESEN